jgi:hypothetical protein
MKLIILSAILVLFTACSHCEKSSSEDKEKVHNKVPVIHRQNSLRSDI